MIFAKKKILHMHTFMPDYMDTEQWIEKTKPAWFASLMQERKRFKPSFEQPDSDKADACPSFVHLFKNSYTLKTICDFYVRPCGDGFEYNLPDSFFEISSHVIQNQMSNDFPPYLGNMKMILPVKFQPEAPMTMMFLPSEYETKQIPFKAMTGVLPLSPKINNQMNVNLWVDYRSFEETFVPKGTPYAFLYFPEGRPDIKMHNYKNASEWNLNVPTTKSSFSFDWFKKEK